MTSRLGIEVRADRIEWAVLHRVLRGPMQLTTGTVVAAVGIDAHGRLVSGDDAGRPDVRERIDRLPSRLGEAAPLVLGGVPYGAERLLASVVAAAVAAGTNAAHDGPLHVVLTHPDALDTQRLGLLTEATRYAGIAATSSLAGATDAIDALGRVPVGGSDRGAAVGAAQLAWERRPDDDHLAAAAGASGGAALVGGSAVAGLEHATVSATAGGAPGPAGTPLVPPVAGPVGTALTSPVAGPAGAPLAAPTPGPVGAPLDVPVATADHRQHHRKRSPRPRGRILVGATAAVVAVGAGVGVGIIAASGDDGTTTRVATTEQVIDTAAAAPAAVTTTVAPVVTVAATEPVDTVPVATAAPAQTAVAATAAPAAPVAPAVPAAVSSGWMIDDGIVSPASGLTIRYESVSCASELGPWHIVVSFDDPTLTSSDISFDVTLSSYDAGTSAGSEHSIWSDGLEATGTSAGTASLASQSTGGYLMLIDYDEDVVIDDPAMLSPETQHNHHSLQLHVLPATPDVCP